MTIGQAMIFCQTRKTASWLVEKMTKDGHAVALLSGIAILLEFGFFQIATSIWFLRTLKES